MVGSNIKSGGIRYIEIKEYQFKFMKNVSLQKN